MIYTEFCTELDPSAVKQVWDVALNIAAGKGVVIADKPKFLLAALNVESYALGKVVGQPAPTGPVFGATGNLTETEVNEAFSALHSAASNKATLGAAFNWANLIKIIITVLSLFAQPQP